MTERSAKPRPLFRYTGHLVSSTITSPVDVSVIASTPEGAYLRAAQACGVELKSVSVNFHTITEVEP